MIVLKIPYQTLIQHGDNGAVRGAHHQFREVIQTTEGQLVAERLLPAVPFGSDPDFPPSTLIGQVASEALALAEVRAATAVAAEQNRDAAVSARDAAIAERDAAIAEKAAAVAQVETLTAQISALNAEISALTAQPERPPGKWWPHAAAFLEEFTQEELLAVHSNQVPLVIQLLMTLLAWNGEVWSSDSRIAMGLQALVSLGVLTPERRAAILAE